MIYEFDSYYLNRDELSLEKAELAVAIVLSQWAQAFEARLLAPVKAVKENRRAGSLPENPSQKAEMIASTLSWIHENSITQDVFYLKLYAAEPRGARGIALFDHHDTHSSWGLNLSPEQFDEAKRAFKDRGLPEDLFFPADQMRFEPYKIFGLIPFGVICYSPNQWRARQPERGQDC